jgi:hypothetical protein
MRGCFLSIGNCQVDITQSSQLKIKSKETDRVTRLDTLHKLGYFLLGIFSHLNNQFQNIVFCRYFNISEVV